MVVVQERFKVGRMDQVLKQFGIERPRGLTNKGKAKLLVNMVPREELMKLLNEAALPPHRGMERRRRNPWQRAHACFAGL